MTDQNEPDCITWHLDLIHPADRPRRCVRRGAHWAACPNPETCTGCVPRGAEYGLICRVCYAKVQDALSRVGNLIHHLRSIDSTGQPLGERVASSKTVKLPVYESWIAADGLMEALGAPPIPSTAGIDEAGRLAYAAVEEWSDLDHIVTTREGAKRAVVLIRRMQTALRRWPDSEVEYRHIPQVRCPSCNQHTLWRKAPLWYEDDILTQCGGELGYDPELDYRCGYTRDWFEWLNDFQPFLDGALKGAA